MWPCSYNGCFCSFVSPFILLPSVWAWLRVVMGRSGQKIDLTHHISSFCDIKYHALQCTRTPEITSSAQIYKCFVANICKCPKQVFVLCSHPSASSPHSLTQIDYFIFAAWSIPVLLFHTPSPTACFSVFYCLFSLQTNKPVINTWKQRMVIGLGEDIAFGKQGTCFLSVNHGLWHKIWESYFCLFKHVRLSCVSLYSMTSLHHNL